MRRKEKALEYFRNSFNCSQSVFTVFGTDFGLKEDDCLRTACAFGGGMGRCQHTCGAATGALMAIGARKGKGLNDPESRKLETYELTISFLKFFNGRNGSLVCKDLLEGLDMNNPAELEEIKKKNLYVVKCEKYITDAVEITEELLIV